MTDNLAPSPPTPGGPPIAYKLVNGVYLPVAIPPFLNTTTDEGGALSSGTGTLAAHKGVIHYRFVQNLGSQSLTLQFGTGMKMVLAAAGTVGLNKWDTQMFFWDDVINLTSGQSNCPYAAGYGSQ